MEWKHAIVRARRGFRDERSLYVVATSSLAVAFLCLGGALLAVENLGAIANRWGNSGRMTIYLADGARSQDVAQLKMVLESLDEVRNVDEVTPAEARAALLSEFDDARELTGLPANILPASLEVDLNGRIGGARIASIASRVSQFRGVDSVDTYRGFFRRLESLTSTGRMVSLAVAFLVALCVVAVVGNTIRLSVARRQSEIEVQKLCGATDAFVRRPFLVEGAIQAFIASFVAVALLALGFVVLRPQVDATIAGLLGIRLVFLSPGLLVALLASGALLGGVGSFLSIRRYLVV